MLSVIDAPRSPKGVDRSWLWIILASILIGGMLFRIIGDSRDKRSLQKKNEESQQALLSTYRALDSVQREIESKIFEIRGLGGRVDTLFAINEELLREKSLIEKKSQEEIQRLRDRLEGYTMLLTRKDEEIAKLRQVNTILYGENKELKEEKNELKSSLKNLGKARKDLEEKVSRASRLSIEDIRISGLSAKGNPLRRLRARRVKSLQVHFRIPPNPITPADGKDILLRIIAPNDRPLYDIHRGGGSFFYQKKEIFYTLKQSVLYNKKALDLDFLYTQPSVFAPGTYHIEVYTEGYLMGKDSFTMK